jgi:hypothetical protein
MVRKPLSIQFNRSSASVPYLQILTIGVVAGVAPAEEGNCRWQLWQLVN